MLKRSVSGSALGWDCVWMCERVSIYVCGYVIGVKDSIWQYTFPAKSQQKTANNLTKLQVHTCVYVCVWWKNKPGECCLQVKLQWSCQTFGEQRQQPTHGNWQGHLETEPNLFSNQIFQNLIYNFKKYVYIYNIQN